MARRSLVLGTLPLVGFVVACATAVDQGFVDDDTDTDTGGSQSIAGGGLSSTGGKPTTNGGQTGSAGKPGTNAFGGTSSSGAGGSANNAGSTAGGQSAGGTSSGAAGKAAGGTGGAGGAGGAGGSAGGAGAGAGAGGKAGSGTGGGGSGGSATGGGGSGGSGGSGSSTGMCAPANTGWVVQYWTGTGAANMPAGDLRIFNNAGGTVNFNTLELRHYFTNEETATLSFIFSTFGHNFPGPPHYADEGGANVQSSIVALAPAETNASHYISIKFNATPGTFANGEYAQLGYYGSLSMYPMKSNQANDYTYVNHPTADPGSANKNTGWDRITLYASGELVWGCEP